MTKEHKQDHGPQYQFVISEETLQKVHQYKLALAFQTTVAGNYLKQRIGEFGQSNVALKDLPDDEFLEILVSTKPQKIFAEIQIQGKGTDWNLTELNILGDVNVTAPVKVRDNGVWEPSDPGFKLHKKPLAAELLFTPGALLTGAGSASDLAEVTKDKAGKEIDQEKYNALVERRLLPILIHASEQAKKDGQPALVTMPGIGCGQFAGIFEGQMGDHLDKAMQAMLEKHQDKLQNIAAIHYDSYAECDNRQKPYGKLQYRVRPKYPKPVYNNSAKIISPPSSLYRPGLSHPTEFQEEGDDFSKCKLYKIVAWDHVSWPGNDFFKGFRRTDDGVAAAATDSMRAITGIEGEYNRETGKYDPPKGYSTWQEVVSKHPDSNKYLKVEQDNFKIVSKDGRYYGFAEFQKKQADKSLAPVAPALKAAELPEKPVAAKPLSKKPLPTKPVPAEAPKPSVPDKWQSITRKVARHWQDRTTAPESHFQEEQAKKPGEKSKATGISAGYKSIRVTDKTPFMIKTTTLDHLSGEEQEAYKQKFGVEHYEQDRASVLREFVTGPLYERVLYNRAPRIEAVTLDERRIGLSSKFLNRFQTFDEFGGENHGDFSAIQGAEKVLATSLFFGEHDLNQGNLGVIDNNGEKVLAKIDHGMSAARFFFKNKDNSQHEIMAKDFLVGFKKRSYHETNLKVNLEKFQEVIDNLGSISDTEIADIIRARVYKLEKLGFDIRGLEIPVWVNDTEHTLGKPGTYKFMQFENLDQFGEFLIDSYKEQRETTKKFSKKLSLIKQIGATKDPAWQNQQWMKYLNKPDSELQAIIAKKQAIIVTVPDKAPEKVYVKEEVPAKAPEPEKVQVKKTEPSLSKPIVKPVPKLDKPVAKVEAEPPKHLAPSKPAAAPKITSGQANISCFVNDKGQNVVAIQFASQAQRNAFAQSLISRAKLLGSFTQGVDQSLDAFLGMKQNDDTAIHIKADNSAKGMRVTVYDNATGKRVASMLNLDLSIIEYDQDAYSGNVITFKPDKLSPGKTITTSLNLQDQAFASLVIPPVQTPPPPAAIDKPVAKPVAKVQAEPQKHPALPKPGGEPLVKPEAEAAAALPLKSTVTIYSAQLDTAHKGPRVAMQFASKNLRDQMIDKFIDEACKGNTLLDGDKAALRALFDTSYKGNPRVVYINSADDMTKKFNVALGTSVTKDEYGDDQLSINFINEGTAEKFQQIFNLAHRGLAIQYTSNINFNNANLPPAPDPGRSKNIQTEFEYIKEPEKTAVKVPKKQAPKAPEKAPPKLPTPPKPEAVPLPLAAGSMQNDVVISATYSKASKTEPVIALRFANKEQCDQFVERISSATSMHIAGYSLQHKKPFEYEKNDNILYINPPSARIAGGNLYLDFPASVITQEFVKKLNLADSIEYQGDNSEIVFKKDGRTTLYPDTSQLIKTTHTLPPVLSVAAPVPLPEGKSVVAPVKPGPAGLAVIPTPEPVKAEPAKHAVSSTPEPVKPAIIEPAKADTVVVKPDEPKPAKPTYPPPPVPTEPKPVKVEPVVPASKIAESVPVPEVVKPLEPKPLELNAVKPAEAVPAMPKYAPPVPPVPLAPPALPSTSAPAPQKIFPKPPRPLKGLSQDPALVKAKALLKGYIKGDEDHLSEKDRITGKQRFKPNDPKYKRLNELFDQVLKDLNNPAMTQADLSQVLQDIKKESNKRSKSGSVLKEFFASLLYEIGLNNPTSKTKFNKLEQEINALGGNKVKKGRSM